VGDSTAAPAPGDVADEGTASAVTRMPLVTPNAAE
jgi:hypothetical protein